MSITKKLFGDWCQSQKEFGQSLKKISEYWKTARDTKKTLQNLLDINQFETQKTLKGNTDDIFQSEFHGHL